MPERKFFWDTFWETFNIQRLIYLFNAALCSFFVEEVLRSSLAD